MMVIRLEEAVSEWVGVVCTHCHVIGCVYVRI